jgi:hypothetical protein
MKSIDGRVSKLENQFGIARSAPRYLLMLMDAGREFAPAEETQIIETLEVAGWLPTSGFGSISP